MIALPRVLDDFVCPEWDWYQEGLLLWDGEPLFKTAHYPEFWNVLGWIRFTKRTMRGEGVLFVEELQSDWFSRSPQSCPLRYKWAKVLLEAWIDRFRDRIGCFAWIPLELLLWRCGGYQALQRAKSVKKLYEKEVPKVLRKHGQLGVVWLDTSRYSVSVDCIRV